jgi:hypothetical protein
MTTTTLILNNGVGIPALGFGVFQTPPDETTAAVETALRVGYRHIDTAAAYANERGVGDAIRRSGVDRDDVFIETKVWISDYGYDQTLHAFDKSAGKLGVDQIDLLILHQALPSRFDLTIDAYKALETLLADGKVRAIGVSNFIPDHLEQLLATTTVIPAVNQVEVHPYFPPARRHRRRPRPRHPHPSLVTDRRHHLLPARPPQQHPAGPDHHRDRRRSRQDGGPDHVALAPAAGPVGHSKVDQPGPHRRELRRLRLRAHRQRTHPNRRARHRHPRRSRTTRNHPRRIRHAHPRGVTGIRTRCGRRLAEQPHEPTARHTGCTNPHGRPNSPGSPRERHRRDCCLTDGGSGVGAEELVALLERSSRDGSDRTTRREGETPTSYNAGQKTTTPLPPTVPASMSWCAWTMSSSR